MIEENALILSLSQHNAFVEIQRQSSCQGCDVRGSCGTSSLSQLFGKRPSQFTLALTDQQIAQGLKVGDVIKIGLEDSSYLKASLLIYIWPLFIMFVMAIFAEQLLQLSDVFVMLFAVFGLWLGFKLGNIKAKGNSALLEPQFIKKLSSDSA